MKLLIATRNKHKVEEMRAILSQQCRDVPWHVSTLLDYPDAPDVEEDGDTFEANAIKKAEEISRKFGVLTLADDSGLEVDALGGQPGVMSARYAGPGASGQDLCKKLLDAMKSVPQGQRTARFICVIAISDGISTRTAEGRVEGVIIREMLGDKGFGYDPVFYYPPFKKTFAQLNMEEKNKISHRGKALLKSKKILKTWG